MSSRQSAPKTPKGGKQDRQTPDGSRLGREVLGLCAIFCGLLVILSLATFDARDPWINHSLSRTPQIYNKAGEFGAYISGSLFDIFGIGAWVVPAFFCIAGARRILGAQRWIWWRWVGFLLLALCACMAGAAGDLGMVEILPRGPVPQGGGDVSTHGGGILGHMLYVGLAGWMGTTGALLVWVCLLLLAVQLLSGMSWLSLGRVSAAFIAKSAQELYARVCDLRVSHKEARVARASRKAEEAMNLATLEALPSEAGPRILDITLPQQDTAGAKRGREPEDVFDSLSNLDRLDMPAPGLPVSGSKDRDDGLFLEYDPESFSSPAARREPPEPADTSLVHPMLLHAPELELGGDSGKRDDAAVPPPDFASPLPPAVAAKTASSQPPQIRISIPDDDEDFLHALWRSAGHEVEPVPSASEKVIRLQPLEDGPKDKAASADVREPSGQADPVAAASAPSVPIHMAEEIEAAPPQPKPGFVDSVLNRMKKPAIAPLPSLELLQSITGSSASTPRHVLEGKGKSLMTCLNDFNVQGELVGITPGPVVTMFEVRPAPGVRVSRIANLSDDLALALKAVAVRIQAPVPGTDTVGIEIPNEIRETVCLKELLGSQLFSRSKSLLTLALGKDIAGNPAVADLATMPHLLVAGATGAGKSVGINSIILSLLYKARPHEVKLLLVDPKRVEMAIYADLPHLVHPVVTEMQLAKNALEWAVSEMEQRYDAIARAGVRNIADYNAKVAAFGDSPPEGMEDLQFMPYLVVIIDELADLMLVAAKEVETSIVRLAQLARAAGIHLILATQRPSVDVVTGLIKANFPCRISFQVTSKHDSRTILDSVGAEHLLGKGDMLFKPGGGKFQRMHGAFVSDKDVNAVVHYWKSQQRPDYQIDFADWSPEGSGPVFTGNGGAGGDIASDPLYAEAVEFVRQQGKASISLIQRKFRIGFNKAARYVEQMEQDGIIGPADGSKPRLVIR